MKTENFYQVIQICINMPLSLHVYNSNQIVTNSTPSVLLLLTNQSSAPISIDGTHTVYKHAYL